MPKPRWTDEELKILRRYWPSEGARCHRRLTGRSEKSVRSQACELKIAMLPEAKQEVRDACLAIRHQRHHQHPTPTRKRQPTRWTCSDPTPEEIANIAAEIRRERYASNSNAPTGQRRLT